ncbi:MAG TPA: glycogen debranching protein GlgX, partial [Pyrinomonadaceae bacterium]
AGRHGEQVAEFKTMVRALHREGIEVILDVVYNHTIEGNHLGPTLSFRGIDNASYYRLDARDPARYVDYSGCGNALNVRHPRTLQLIMDSLRYWIQEMHVDGFRFDLAAALARELHEVDRLSAFFDIIHQDPVISQVKLIAEPWDLGEGGYQVGNFPVLWSEWNGIYRDAVRSFWRGDAGRIDDLAFRLTGSSDLYERSGRRPYASVNFVTAHDGFTLADLTSYNEKHNEANGEGNRDGHDHNLGWNCGVEGRTDDPDTLELRARQRRNFLATLLLSQGVPMLLAGDEMGRTQHGNNNAYCQDNELSWVDWNLDESQRELLEFTRQLIRLFHTQPVLRRRKFFHGRQVRGAEIKDVSWLRPDGEEMTAEDWRDDQTRSLCVRLAGDAIDETDERGRAVFGDTLLILLNVHHRPVSFHLPAHREDVHWEQLFDTREPAGRRKTRRLVKGGASYRTEAHSLALFRLQVEVEATPVEAGDVRSAREAMEPTGTATTTGPLTQSVYCARAERIVPLDEGFCRACSRQVAEGDGIHHEPTPEVLKRMGYVTTALPEPEDRGEETPGDESQSEEG